MLEKIQKQLASDIVARRASGKYVGAENFSPGESVRIYSNNYYLSLTEALKITYPTLIKLVGDDFFKYLARKFIEQYPHDSGDLTMFGKELDKFITNSADCAKLPYLADVARLEWALEMSYHALDIKSQQLEPLYSLQEKDYGKLKFTLSPGVYIIKSKYPIFDIWQFDGKSELDLDQTGQNVLVWKQDFEVMAEIIDDNLIEFLQNLKIAKNLEQAFTGLDNFDLSGNLNMLINKKIIDSVYLEQ